MKSELPNEGTPASNWQSIYQKNFLGQVHRLLELGYLRIREEDYSATDEETISGDICEAIEGILDDKRESWMTFYQVHNERPVQQKGKPKAERTRQGKRRQKIDIEIASAEASPRLRFAFEAKLLCDSKSVSAYVGGSGLGCFVNGDYSEQDSSAGMVGFMQSRTREEWTQKIETRMSQQRKQTRLRTKSTWSEGPISIDGSIILLSKHDRVKRLGAIDIYHTLLDFRSKESLA